MHGRAILSWLIFKVGHFSVTCFAGSDNFQSGTVWVGNSPPGGGQLSVYDLAHLAADPGNENYIIWSGKIACYGEISVCINFKRNCENFIKIFKMVALCLHLGWLVKVLILHLAFNWFNWHLGVDLLDRNAYWRVNTAPCFNRKLLYFRPACSLLTALTYLIVVSSYLRR